MARARTPENPPKCIFPSLGKILRFEADVCADLGKFGQIFDQMYMSNPGNFPSWDEVCVTIQVKSGVQGWPGSVQNHKGN